MRPSSDLLLVQSLHDCSFNHSEIARVTGIPRSTVKDWLRDGRTVRDILKPEGHSSSEVCPAVTRVDPTVYSYLLGLYLGDGCISRFPNGVFSLRITCCNAYPELMDLCADAIASVLPGNKVSRTLRVGCSDVTAYSKHWPCLFPQHGPGRKHERPIVLHAWQEAIVGDNPRELLRGLVHSDGCRSLNWVKGRPYSRYTFSNASDDIRAIFCGACDQLGIEWRQMNARNISVARRASVEFMDTFIGPKT